MAQLNQLVGIIELDADPDLDTPLDENIGQTLRRLRSCDDAGPDAATLSLCSDAPCWHDVDDSQEPSVVVLKADLAQLRCELESELAMLLDRLLLPSK